MKNHAPHAASGERANNTTNSHASALSANTLTLVRGGSPDDVARLLACGGRILAQGTHISVQEWPAMGTLDAPYALVAVGKRQVLIVLLAG